MDTDPSKIESGKRRTAIDTGTTGDKVPAADPAAAPMDSDSEAAGAPTPAAAAQADVRRQQSTARNAGAEPRVIMAGADPAARAGPRVAVIGVVVVAAAMLIGILIGVA